MIQNPIDQLVADLARPIYVLRMASAMERAEGPQGKSARKRATQARDEIAQIVREFTRDHS